jgi:hypothetical protein
MRLTANNHRIAPHSSIPGNYLISFLLIFFACVQASLGADFWEKKEYTKWSAKECRKMLTDSPWAKEYKQQQVIVSSSGRADAMRGGESSPYVVYYMQLRSALPIRQAIVRQMQLAQDYDKLSNEQKQQFDNQTDGFLNANFDSVVVVYVTYGANIQQNDIQLSRHWQMQTTELLQNSVFLRGSEGDKVPIAGYAVESGDLREFQFVFPRKIDEKEILGPDDKSLQLEFSYPVVGGMGDGNGYLEFKTKKMKYNGKLEY